MNLRILIRGWVVGGSPAYGLYVLGNGLHALATGRESHWAVRWLFMAPFLLFFSGTSYRNMWSLPCTGARDQGADPRGTKPSALLRAFCLVVLTLLILPPPLAAGTVRVAFLTEAAPLRDTLDLLRRSGCSPDGVSAFQRAVGRYAASELNLDLKRFPPAHDGFYSFGSASNLVAALPHPLCDTDHPYEFNCFDTVTALAGRLLRTKTRPDDLVGPFLVPYTPTNGSFTILPKATARDAFTQAYPAWYREVTETALPEAVREARISLTAALFRCHLLPQSTTEESLSARVLDALRGSWRQQELRFPSRFQVVLCHEVMLPQRWFVTAHAGLLFPRHHGWTYLEKSGGSGPFVRLDLEDRAELLVWLAAIFRGGERLGYTHHLATFGDRKIEFLH